MYTEFYRLSAMPFQLTPDSRFFFGSSEHNKAMAFLKFGVSQGEGFVVVTGEIGAGKTTLVQHLLSTLDSAQYVSGQIVTTQLNSYDMLRMAAAAFGLFREGVDKAALVLRFKQMLGDLHAQKKRALLVIDEAQSLTTEALEELRMLSNIVVGAQAPLQSILLGQPEFRSILASPGLEQLRQRVIASCHLGALNHAETRSYIEYRLRCVGWTDDPNFSDDAFIEIYRFTGGIPRRINALCSRLLLLGFLDERHAIDGAMVCAVADELAAELGPLTNGIPLPSAASPREPESLASRHGSDNLEHRVMRIELKTEQHEKVIGRALTLAARFLPGDK